MKNIYLIATISMLFSIIVFITILLMYINCHQYCDINQQYTLIILLIIFGLIFICSPIMTIVYLFLEKKKCIESLDSSNDQPFMVGINLLERIRGGLGLYSA